MNRTARTLGIMIPVALLTVAMPIDAMAQRGERGQGRGARARARAEGEARGERGERIAEALGLTEEQQAAVCDIRSAAAEKRKAVFANYEGAVRENREAIRDELKVIHESTHDALAEVLTAEQLETVEKMGKRRRQRGGRRGGNEGAGGRGPRAGGEVGG